MRERPAISKTELEVLKVLWTLDSGTVRDIEAVLRGRGRSWAYNTILTLLQRLQSKGYVRSDKRALAHVFRPAVSREDLLRQSLRSLKEKVCEGTAAPLVRAMVEGQRFTAEEIAELKDLVEKLDRKRSETEGKRKKETEERS